MFKKLLFLSVLILGLLSVIPALAGDTIGETVPLYVEPSTLINQSDCVQTNSWHFVLVGIGGKPETTIPTEMYGEFEVNGFQTILREKITGNVAHYRYDAFATETRVNSAWINVPSGWNTASPDCTIKLLLSCDKVTNVDLVGFSANSNNIRPIILFSTLAILICAPIVVWVYAKKK